MSLRTELLPGSKNQALLSLTHCFWPRWSPCLLVLLHPRPSEPLAIPIPSASHPRWLHWVLTLLYGSLKNMTKKKKPNPKLWGCCSHCGCHWGKMEYLA